MSAHLIACGRFATPVAVTITSLPTATQCMHASIALDCASREGWAAYWISSHSKESARLHKEGLVINLNKAAAAIGYRLIPIDTPSA